MNPAVMVTGAGAFVIALLFPVTILYVFSRVSGWNTLAEHYPAREPAPEPRKWTGSGVFRYWIGYNGGIVISSDRQGLYLAAMPVVLSFCHKPIFIPWSEIREIRKARSLMSDGYEIRALRTPDVRFMLRSATFDFVKSHAREAGVAGDYA